MTTRYENSAPARQAASGTQAVDRAAELLSLVVTSVESRQFADLVAGTGLPKSTASRLLQALERHHLLYRDEQGGYSPGALFVGYTARHDPVDQLAQLADPALRAINEQTGETVNLAVPHGAAVVQIAQVDSTFVLGVTNWVGVDVPPHCSALGKVCYAFGGLEVPKRLSRRTDKTISSRATLLAELSDIRRDGYAMTRGELELGLDGLAAPLLGPGGQLVAALGLSGPTERIAPQHDELATLLVTRARELSGDLGHLTRTLGSETVARRSEPRQPGTRQKGNAMDEREGAA